VAVRCGLLRLRSAQVRFSGFVRCCLVVGLVGFVARLVLGSFFCFFGRLLLGSVLSVLLGRSVLVLMADYFR